MTHGCFELSGWNESATKLVLTLDQTSMCPTHMSMVPKVVRKQHCLMKTRPQVMQTTTTLAKPPTHVLDKVQTNIVDNDSDDEFDEMSRFVDRVCADQEVLSPSKPLQATPSPTVPTPELSAYIPNFELLLQGLQREPLIQREPTLYSNIEKSPPPPPKVPTPTCKTTPTSSLDYFAARSTNRLFFVLCMTLRWTTVSVKYNNAVIQSKLNKPKWTLLPSGFNSHPGTCLWTWVAIDGFKKRGFSQYKFDPCLLFKPDDGGSLWSQCWNWCRKPIRH